MSKATLLKAIPAGIVGTLVMTAVGLFAAPMMGIPKMNPADMLAGQMGNSALLGWMAHLMIGVVLAAGYALWFASRLPGSPAVRGALFSIIPYLMAELLVIPMMGMPVFSGSVAMAMGSLIGHVVYGVVIGVMIGAPERQGAFATA